ncbi:MAG TPA: hypothetical protein VFP34_13515 [Microlunatus sp.]|nr:hypothetical protein [Microlunatus sp.]
MILQFWSETVVDADLHAVLVEQIERLRASVQQALLPWAAAQPASDDAVGLAHRTAQARLIMAQGYLANRTLLGWMSAQDYLESVATAFGQPVRSQPDPVPAV